MDLEIEPGSYFPTIPVVSMGHLDRVIHNARKMLIFVRGSKRVKERILVYFLLIFRFYLLFTRNSVSSIFLVPTFFRCIILPICEYVHISKLR